MRYVREMLLSLFARTFVSSLRASRSMQVGVASLTLAVFFGACDTAPTRDVGEMVSTTTTTTTNTTTIIWGTESDSQQCPVGKVGCACALSGSPCELGLTCVAGLCSDSPADDSTTTSGSEGTSSTEADTGTTTTPGESNTGEETTTPTDTNDESTTETSSTEDSGCSKVDFLLVVDNSPSMQDEQQHLIDSLPTLFELAAKHAAPEDAHFMVVDTGYDTASVCSQDACTCISSAPRDSCCPSACAESDASTCNGRACTDFPYTCDFKTGSGRTFNRTLQECGFVAGKRFLTGSQANTKDALACALDEGVDGSGLEKIVQTMTYSVSGFDLQLAACNQGFLRDDALLFVVFVTDEEEKAMEGSPGNPDTWVTDLKAVKHNEPDGIVMVGLYGDPDQPDAICLPLDSNFLSGAEESPRLREFVEGFGEYGHSASVCAEDYRPAFEQGFALLEKACSSRRERLGSTR